MAYMVPDPFKRREEGVGQQMGAAPPAVSGAINQAQTQAQGAIGQAQGAVNSAFPINLPGGLPQFPNPGNLNLPMFDISGIDRAAPDYADQVRNYVTDYRGKLMQELANYRSGLMGLVSNYKQGLTGQLNQQAGTQAQGQLGAAMARPQQALAQAPGIQSLAAAGQGQALPSQGPIQATSPDVPGAWQPGMTGTFTDLTGTQWTTRPDGKLVNSQGVIIDPRPGTGTLPKAPPGGWPAKQDYTYGGTTYKAGK